MSIEWIEELYEYSAWANGRILEQAAALTSEQFLAEGGRSFGSVRNTLVHILSGQWMWLSRWKGSSPHKSLEASQSPVLDKIRSRWRQVELDTQLFIASLDVSSLERVVEYVDLEGNERAFLLWQTMIHQVNHATQHRSEAAMILTRYGQSPGWLDFSYYLELQKSTIAEEPRV